MIDVQPDSPVPVHQQIADQIRGLVAAEALTAGARLPDARALAQELLTNPQAVARAYADLEDDGVLRKGPAGGVEVTAGAATYCRLRLQDDARRRLRDAVLQAVAAGLGDADLRAAVDHALAAARAPTVPPAALATAVKVPTAHDTRHRADQGIQDLSRQAGPGRPEPDRPGGGDLRPPRG